MNSKLIITLAAAVVIGLFGWQAGTAGDKGQSKPERKSALETGIEVKFDAVRPARSLVRRTVFDKNEKPIGYVTDVVIDSKHGHLAFIVIVPDRAADQKGRERVLPAARLLESRKDDDRLFVNTTEQQVKAQPAGDNSTQFGRMTGEQIQTLHEQYGVSPFWHETKVPDRKLRLVTLDELDGRVVRNTDWIQMGRIDDVILLPDRHWQVGYVVLRDFATERSKGQRLAVPLAAFAHRTASPTWLLDLDPLSLPATQTFEGDDLPHRIDRSWIEYVHVKYGSATLSGMQDLQME